jgi:YD repeat-containing protein
MFAAQVAATAAPVPYGHYLRAHRVQTTCKTTWTSPRANEERRKGVIEVRQPQVANGENGGALVRPRIRTTYDKNSNVIDMTDPRGVVTQSTYDQLNRVRATTQAVGKNVAVTTEREYDANKNVVALTLQKTTGTQRTE